MDAYQEDEISRLSAIISNLKVDYESTISVLQKDLAKATAAIAELDQENQELAHTLQEIDQECSDTTSSLESLVQENRDLRRRLDELVHENEELAAKLHEKKQRGSEHTSKDKVELMPVDNSLRNDYSVLTDKSVNEENYWDCLQNSNQPLSRKQDSINTLETLYSYEVSLPSKVTCNTCSDQSSGVFRSISQPLMSDTKFANQINLVGHIEVEPVQKNEKFEAHEPFCIKEKGVKEKLMEIFGVPSLLLPKVRSVDSLLVDFGKRPHSSARKSHELFRLSR
jgi:predicted nuclease with TOPRIM domain